LAYPLVLPYHLQIVPSCHIKIFGYNSTSDFDVFHKNQNTLEPESRELKRI